MLHPHDVYSHVEPWTVRIEYLAKEYVKRGHEVRLIYFPLDTGPEHLRERRHPDGYRTIPFCRWRKLIPTNCRRIMEHADWADVVHFQKCHSWAMMPAVWGAYRADKPLHYDWDDWEVAIYNYDPPSLVTGWMLAAKEYTVPGMVDTITVASAELRRLALAAGVPDYCLFDGHVGADTEIFHPHHDGARVRAQRGIAPDQPLVMYLGQLHGAQYAELFLHAARYLTLLRPESPVRFMVVGYGGRFEELKTLAVNLGIGERTIFTGAIEHAKVPAYLAAANAVVACFEDNEQQRSKSPLKIAEYMACGKAIIASRVGEVPRMLGDAGLLVEPGDAWAIARAAQGLLDDPERCVELGKQARARGVARFDWRVTASNHLEAYELAKHLHARRKRGFFGRWRDFSRHNKDVLGIRDGKRAFVGPESVQIDLTDRCNSDCVACWTHSPLVTGGERLERDELDWPVVEKLLRELAELGTRAVYFSGGGDPSAHPRWLDALELTRELGMRAVINSNLLLLDEAGADRIVAAGVDLVIASLWAASGEVYSRTHPSAPPEAFDALCAQLRRLADIKDRARTRLRAYHVISPANVDELEAMVAHACELGADEIEFAPVDSIPGKTDGLHLSPEQLERALAACERIRFTDHHNRLGHRLEVYELDTFVARLSHPRASEGIYDEKTINPKGCYVGWTFARVHADGHVAPCLKCHKVDQGNVNTTSFKAIWTGEAQQRFRGLTRDFAEGDPFFSLVGNDPSEPMGCFKSCDDRGRNWDMQARLDHLSATKRLLLQADGLVARSL